MKPRTKLQVEVVELSSRLLRISESQKQWAYQHCLEHKGYATKNRVICLDCGETFSPELVKRKAATCPHCKTKIKVEKSRKTTDKQMVYFAIADVMGEFQVIRNYQLEAYYKKGLEKVIHQSEILQYWITPNGKVEMFGLRHIYNWGCDSWTGTHEIRKKSNTYWNSNRYDIYPYKYHPDSYFKPEYSKYGINNELEGLTAIDAIDFIPKNPKAETLLKSKQYSLLNYVYNSQYKLSNHWRSIKICLRNKYKVKDASMWFDYLDLLIYFKKDTRNAKFVCPANLKKEHDRLMNKKRKIMQAEERERERQRVVERQKRLEDAVVQYIERVQKFFDLEFTNGNISITVLKSVDEFKTEGDELKHCVYTNEYYLKQDSLILSARVDGKRTETIELKLPSLKIEQARGMNNNPTDYHDEIVKLMKKSIPKIRAIIKKSAPKQEKELLKQSA